MSRYFTLKIGAGILWWSLLSPQLQAHPHSFISLVTTIVADNEQFLGLKMRWTMDEMTSADLLYDAGDAKPDAPVWKKLAAEVMANVQARNYFTELWRNNKKVTFSLHPQDYHLENVDNQAVLRFTLLLAEPQPLKGDSYHFSTFDPTYFVDMYYEQPTDAQLPVALSHRCQIAVKAPKPDADVLAFAQALDKADAPPEDMQLGQQFAQRVNFKCL